MAAFLRIGAKNAPRQSARVGRRDCSITVGALLIGALMALALFVPRDVAASSSPEISEEKEVDDEPDVAASLEEASKGKKVVDESDALSVARATELAEELTGNSTPHLREEVEKAIKEEQRADLRARKNMIATASLIGIGSLLGMSSAGVDLMAYRRSDVTKGVASGANLSKAGDGLMYASAGVFAAGLISLIALSGTAARVLTRNARKHVLQDQLLRSMQKSEAGQQ